MKVLVVDDEKLGRDSLQTVLLSCDFEVQTAPDGPGAVDKAKGFYPDVVIIDWVLGPPMDGLELAQALREMQPSVRIVIVSGRSDVKRWAPRDAPYDFLIKPFQLAELLALLSTDGDIE